LRNCADAEWIVVAERVHHRVRMQLETLLPLVVLEVLDVALGDRAANTVHFDVVDVGEGRKLRAVLLARRFEVHDVEKGLNQAHVIVMIEAAHADREVEVELPERRARHLRDTEKVIRHLPSRLPRERPGAATRSPTGSTFLLSFDVVLEVNAGVERAVRLLW